MENHVNPTDFPEANFTFGRPPSLTDEQCKPLKVHRGTDQDGLPVSVSRWEPTSAELQELVAGGPVWLLVYGGGHPVVALSARSPFPDEHPAEGEAAGTAPRRPRSGLRSLLSIRDRWAFAAKNTSCDDRAQALRSCAQDLTQWIADGLADFAEDVRRDEAETLAAAGLPGPDPILDLGDEGDAPAPQNASRPDGRNVPAEPGEGA
jgi:hypothetical protein